MKVREFMQCSLVRCLPGMSVGSVAGEMERRHVDTAVVVEGSLAAIGILTARDVLRYLGAGGSEEVPVEDVMTRGVAAIDVDAHVEDAVAAMDVRGVRHLLVVDFGGYPVGVLFRDDVVDVVRRQTLTVDALGTFPASPVRS